MIHESRLLAVKVARNRLNGSEKSSREGFLCDWEEILFYFLCFRVAFVEKVIGLVLPSW